MLQAMRSQITGWIGGILIGLLVLSFAVWGIGDIFRGPGQETIVVTVGDAEMDLQEFDFRVNNELQRLRQALSPTLTLAEAREFGVVETALDRVLSEMALSAAGANLGLLASRDVLTAAIQADPTFHNSAGRFDANRFRTFLNRAGFTEGLYLAELSRSIVQRVSQAPVVRPPPPAALTDALVAFEGEQRTGQVIYLDAADERDPAPPDEAALQTLYAERGDRYRGAARRAVEAVVIDPATLAAEIAIDPSEIEREYEDRAVEFTRPERRTIVQATAREELQAQALAEAATDVASLQAAAEAQSLLVSELTDVTVATLPSALAAPAFALEIGTAPAVVQSAFGWHVVMVTDITPATITPLADVRDTIRDDLALNDAYEAVSDLSDALEDELAGGGSLADAAGTVAMELTQAAVTRQGLGGDRQALSPLLPATIASAAFDAAMNEVVGPIDLDDGGIGYVVAVADVDPVTPPLEDIRDQLIADWQSDQRREATRARAEGVLTALKAGAPTDLAVQTLGPVTRSEQVLGMPAVVHVRLFEMAVGETAVVETQDGFAAVLLDRIDGPEADTLDMLHTTIRDRLALQMTGEQTEMLAVALRDELGVTVNRSAIDRYYDEATGVIF